MVVTDMQRPECIELLTRNRLARLGCVHNGLPYVVPLSYAADERWVYAVSTVGQKIDWLRENPVACIEVDEIGGADHWMSVVITGHFEELPDTPELHEARTHAYDLLKRDASWWEPAYEHVGKPEPHTLDPVYFRVSMDVVTGRRVAAT
jgi:nitroimidazol reductase NimA-like FMN-containing flavoprotein (pyridoxamine 5'-phosphate oxidase superfamily)